MKKKIKISNKIYNIIHLEKKEEKKKRRRRRVNKKTPLIPLAHHSALVIERPDTSQIRQLQNDINNNKQELKSDQAIHNALLNKVLENSPIKIKEEKPTITTKLFSESDEEQENYPYMKVKKTRGSYKDVRKDLLDEYISLGGNDNTILNTTRKQTLMDAIKQLQNKKTAYLKEQDLGNSPLISSSGVLNKDEYEHSYDSSDMYSGTNPLFNPTHKR